MAWLHRHKGLIPYLLLAPGLAFLALFFVVPTYYLANTSLQEGSVDVGYTFTIPESGSTLWSDNLMVPIASPHKKNAEKLFDFYYDPKVAATAAAYINYICPVEGAKAEMEKIDPELAASPLIFPTEADLANVKVFRTLSADEETKYSEEFQKVIGA